MVQIALYIDEYTTVVQRAGYIISYFCSLACVYFGSLMASEIYKRFKFDACMQRSLHSGFTSNSIFDDKEDDNEPAEPDDHVGTVDGDSRSSQPTTTSSQTSQQKQPQPQPQPLTETAPLTAQPSATMGSLNTPFQMPPPEQANQTTITQSAPPSSSSSSSSTTTTQPAFMPYQNETIDSAAFAAQQTSMMHQQNSAIPQRRSYSEDSDSDSDSDVPPVKDQIQSTGFF